MFLNNWKTITHFYRYYRLSPALLFWDCRSQLHSSTKIVSLKQVLNSLWIVFKWKDENSLEKRYEQCHISHRFEFRVNDFPINVNKFSWCRFCCADALLINANTSLHVYTFITRCNSHVCDWFIPKCSSIDTHIRYTKTINSAL